MSLLAAPLDHALASRSKVRLLRLLLTHSEPLSGREAGRRVRMAKRSVDMALRELTALGLVVREDTPAQALYRANRRHHLVKVALAPLFAAEQRWTDELFTVLQKILCDAAAAANATIQWAGIFGSTARGDEQPESDLDIAVITDTGREAAELHDLISARSDEFSVRFGRRLSPLVRTATQFRKLTAAADPLALALKSDARRLVGSRDIAEVLRGRP